MPTLDQIKQQIKNLPDTYIFYTKKEINYLPQVMVEGEEIRALTSGFAGGRTILAVCTNRRILFLDKGMFFGLRQWQVGLDRVQSVDGSYVILFGTIRIWDGAAAIVMNMVWASSIDPFIKTVRNAIDEFRKISFRETIGHAAPAPAAVDIASQLERLARLKEQGHLTEEEFQAQKKKLLG